MNSQQRKLEQLKGRLWFHTKMENKGMIEILKARIDKFLYGN